MKKTKTKNKLFILTSFILAFFSWNSSAMPKSVLPQLGLISTLASVSEGIGTTYLPAELSKASDKTVTINALTNALATKGADETFKIVLNTPGGAALIGKKTKSSTISDDDHKTVANVKKLGAKGDGVADDSAAIQKAVDQVFMKGGGVVFFPPGTYMVKSVNIRENITYQGDQATITRPARQGKWTRTFTTQNKPYSGTEDSKPLIIKNLTFDGNSQNQGPYQNWELEQAHLIFLMGNPSQPGRLRAIIKDCHFKNGVGDGISQFVNVDLKVYNCEAENVFRGGWVLTGGHSKAYVKNFVTRGNIDPTGIDIEVAGKGYGNTFDVNVVLEDVTCIDGDCDLGFPGGNSTLVATRVKSFPPPFGLLMAKIVSFFTAGESASMNSTIA